MFLPSSETTPTVGAAFTLSSSGSPFLTGSTTSLSFAPTTRSSKCVSSCSSYRTGGVFPSIPTRLPISLSDFTTLGSSVVMNAMLPPGSSSGTFCPPLINETTFVRSGFQIFWLRS